MAAPSDGVRQFLDRDDWRVAEAVTGETTIFETIFAGSEQAWAVRVSAYDMFGQVIVESLLPLDVPSQRRRDLEALLHEINWHLLTGAFLVDPSTAEIRFRNSLLLPDGEVITDRLVKGLVYSNVLTVDRCWHGLAVVTEGAMDARSAFAALAL